MSKRKKSDITAIGNIYGDILNKVRSSIVSESKKIPHGEIGNVELIQGGPQEKGGFAPAKVDKKNKNKQKKDKPNAYNIDNLSDNTDEDEEFLAELKKNAKARLNTFMIKKSVFDTLYESMLNDEDGEMGFDSMEDADADALIDDLGGEEGEDVTVEVGGIKLMLSRSDAEALKSSLEAQLEGEMEAEGGFEDEMEDEEGSMYGGDFADEDEEDEGDPKPESGKPNMGKNNKVSNLKSVKAGAAPRPTMKMDVKEYGHALHNATQPDMGKNNKVGNLKPGTNVFG
jgi:antitoxin component of MazEF toxin-antitoxin module